jgi:MFS superfamily sulfate permease-like transporter
MIAASARFHFAERGIAVIGPVPGGLPSIKLPYVSWDETLALLPVAASCFVMIIAQSAATSRVYAVRHHERVDEDADILGLAAANAAAAVSGTFVVNGSPTQTAMADSAGFDPSRDGTLGQASRRDQRVTKPRACPPGTRQEHAPPT